jgi:hypothetical protein
MNARDIQQYIKQTTDNEGNPVIQIPLEVWQRFINEKPISQIEQISALLDEWEQEPAETMPDNWWDEFTAFIRTNRLNLNGKQ